MRRFALALLSALAVAAGCSETDADMCRVGADCASGACGTDGVCLPVGATTGPSSSSSGGAAASSSAAQGGSGGATVATVGTGGSGLCMPNGDGQIEASELLMQPGLSSSLRVAQDVTVDVSGAVDGGGERTWDFTGALEGDHPWALTTLPIAGSWFEGVFDDATYAVRLSDEEELLGVFRVTADQLLLVGVVSPEAGLDRTELEYDPPVPILDLPLSQGKTWSALSTVSGLAQGFAALYTEQYEFEVDRAGTAKTPYADFPVLRVHTELERTVGLLVTTVHSHAFMAECFGSVASVRSQDNESLVEFTDAAEVSRLTP